jgi:hypothetical protein
LQADLAIDEQDAVTAHACLANASAMQSVTGETCWRDVLHRVAGRVPAAR